MGASGNAALVRLRAPRVSRRKSPQRMPSIGKQVAAFVARFSPEVAAQFRKARATVRAQFPRGFELVFDNYNAFGCGYSTTAKSSGVVVSVVAYPRWVTLFFFNGTRLPDPDGVLQGTGSRIRSLRLDPPSLLNSTSVRRLLKLAIAPHGAALAAAPRLSTQIKSIVARQMPRRPAATRVAR